MSLRDTLEEWRRREVCAVFDASPLIYLTRTGVLEDVIQVYKEVFIPQSVKREVIDTGMTHHRPDAFILEEHIKNVRIKVKRIENMELFIALSRNPRIHTADAEAICLAEERTCVLVMDDPKAVDVARLRGITVEPTLTVILIGYVLGYIDLKKAETSYRELLKTQFRVKADVYERALELLKRAEDEIDTL